MSVPQQVLIAEDDELLAQFIALQLIECGHLPLIVGDGEEAVTAALSYRYDMVLLDWQMPKLNGLAAATLLRQLGYNKPLVLMSADVVDTPVVDFCLQKPLHMSELIACLGGDPIVPFNFIVAPELQQQFKSALADIEQALRHAADTQDELTIRRLIHQLKGSAESFGAGAIAEAADQLQRCWQHKPLQTEQLTDLMQLLAKEQNHVA
ncbi:hypothetical protein A5320_09315 [Rheinheimera sp. SA_1]|uniref:response regulator n=1 Tax=Rheinheimera sp. SA_1 TaxID=1827365 RepID=UPI0007FC7423|nr:response regulator [Rheinheimera sp. SA_1]OBP15529.1 hypothetical protein A5320_09315 [Rheinheimera sp. SA_1]